MDNTDKVNELAKTLAMCYTKEQMNEHLSYIDIIKDSYNNKDVAEPLPLLELERSILLAMNLHDKSPQN